MSEDPGTGYYDHDQSHLLGLVAGKPKSVLEVGCASGGMLQHFLSGGAERVVGVEVVESVAEIAKSRCPGAEVFAGSIDDLSLSELGGDFDLVVASFVLEHVVDPWETLEKLKGMLRPGGQLLGCLPNVRHWSVLLPLVTRGRWDYVEDGILDRTHYRFFTKATIEGILTETGFSNIEILPHMGGGKSVVANRVTMGRAVDFFCFAYRFSAYVN